MKAKIFAALCIGVLIALCLPLDASYSPNSDPRLDIARGIAGQIDSVNKFGRNTDVDTAAAEDIWDGGALHVAPTAARFHDIESTDADDDQASGKAALQVTIYGLTSWSTVETFEIVNMDGLTKVTTANMYVFINRMIVTDYGDTGPNVGTITATASTDGTISAQINPGQGQTQMAAWSCSSVDIAYIYKYYASFNKSAGAASGVDISLMVNEQADTQEAEFVVKHTAGAISDGNSNFEYEYAIPAKIICPAIIKVRAEAGANNLDVSAGFDVVLVEN